MTNKNENLETGFKMTSAEHVEDSEIENEEKGFVLIDRVDVIKFDSEKKKMEDNKTDHSIDQEGRYKFYIDKRATKKHPVLIDKDSAEMLYLKYNVATKESAEVTTEQREMDMKNKEFIKEIEKRKEWISNFGDKIGSSNLKKRFPDNDKIYLLPEKTFEEITQEETWGGFSCPNEIFIKNDKNQRVTHFAAQHEILHHACISRIYLREEAKNYTVSPVSEGYSGKEHNKNRFGCFFEGLLETTNQQICLENNSNIPRVAYFELVIFITELIKDITKKIQEKAKEIEKENSKEKTGEFIKSIPQKLGGQKREITKEELEIIREELTEEEVLAHFQRGMFEGDRGHLKIIKDYCGAGTINALATMENDTEDILRISRIFGLQTVIDKINEFNENFSTEIDIGPYGYSVIDTPSLGRSFVKKTRVPKS